MRMYISDSIDVVPFNDGIFARCYQFLASLFNGSSCLYYRKQRGKGEMLGSFFSIFL